MANDSYEKIIKGEGADSHNVDWKKLRTFCQKLFMTQGMPEEEAFTAADCLVDADLCGVPSHGASRMAIYLKRLETKVVNADFKPVLEKEYPASILMNAKNGMGMVAGVYAMELAVKKAKESGSCFVFVNNSNHLGMVGYYVRRAAELGMLGFATTSAPPAMAPWGSKASFLGTSPVAMAVPGKNEPVLLDMAPSLVAMGKVILAAKLGSSIPEGWALDANGKPTTDPNEGMKGTVVPIGGAKGSGLSMFSQILGGIIPGAKYGPHVGSMWDDFVNPQEMGHLFVAVDISKMLDLDTFKDALEVMRGEVKGLPKAEGVSEIFMPGEIEQNRRKERQKEGIVFSNVVYEELRGLGEKYGADFII